MKRALILDLDNTIYPVSSIADNLFKELFKVLDQYAGSINMGGNERVNKIKDEMTRRPFQYIADEFNLDDRLRNKMIKVLKNMAYDLPMQPFEDYQHIRSIPLDKFLVTTGFVKLQMSKVKMLGIEDDFKTINIVDPEVNRQTKKDVFAEIMEKHNYRPEELLVIGDDPESEIRAAKALAIDTVLYDPWNKYPRAVVTYRADNFKKVAGILAGIY
ncbi:MAG: family hydrolase [Mucilaginibacter sp.]|nr:family hydrolase [Mucilaginibacter sp.]